MAIPLRSPSPSSDTGRAAAASPAPRLRVVERRRRWPAVVVSCFAVFVLGAMLGAAVFHTQLAERQLRIDRLDRQLDEEHARFDQLRNERAVLRSPSRIAGEASRLGMVPGETSRFVSIDPKDLARQLAAAGPAADEERVVLVGDVEPLDQVRDVKAVTAGDP